MPPRPWERALAGLSHPGGRIAAAAVALLLAGGIGAWLADRALTTLPPSGAGARVEVKLPPLPQAAPSALPALIEASPEGPLPIIGPDGRQPWQIYARPFDRADPRPRIALVIAGLGLDGEMTRRAIERLPGAVTLAFTPYAQGLPAWIEAARKARHEVLLGLPMEPTDYPSEDPGPATLLVSLEPAQNLDRLRWVMSRGTAYVGLAGIMGERFTTVRASLTPIFQAIKARGLMYVDGRAAADSIAADVGRQIGLAWAAADGRLEGEAAPAAIDKALADLEAIAARRGAALGFGNVYPMTIERVAAWAATLDGKGLVLAPSTAVAIDQAPAKAPPNPAP